VTVILLVEETVVPVENYRPVRESWTKTEYHGWQYLATALLLIVHFNICNIYIYISIQGHYGFHSFPVVD
jgi:hypothetical protein